MLLCLIPNIKLSATDNQLITEIRVFDNDSTFRYLYLYDNLGNKVLETKYFQQNNIWIRNSLNEWLYNGNKCISQIERKWKNDAWVTNYTIDYIFNNEQLDSEIHNIFDNGKASLFKKIVFKYDAENLTSKTEYNWLNNSWSLSLETDFSFLQNGKTNSITTTNFQSGKTNYQLLSTFNYSAEGNLKSELLQEYIDSKWVNVELINWYYLSNSSTIASTRNKKWMSETASWENTQLLDYQYNDNSDVISETYQRWNSMFWDNDIRYDYQYDNSNRLLKKTLSKQIYNDWRSLISINYSNFSMNKANTIESKFDFWGGITGELTTSFIPFMFNDNLSIQKGRSLHISYIPQNETELMNPFENNSIQNIPVYPNPSDGIFYINTQKCNIKSWTVTDINGQILKNQKQTFTSGVIDLTDFPKGIYVLKVATSDQQLIQKLIKK